jgi:hypothetical protein
MNNQINMNAREAMRMAKAALALAERIAAMGIEPKAKLPTDRKTLACAYIKLQGIVREARQIAYLGER